MNASRILHRQLPRRVRFNQLQASVLSPFLVLIAWWASSVPLRSAEGIRDLAWVFLFPGLAAGTLVGFLLGERIRHICQLQGSGWKRVGRTVRIARPLLGLVPLVLLLVLRVRMGDDAATAFMLTLLYGSAGVAGSLVFGTILLERLRLVQLWVTHYPSRSDPEFVAYAVFAAPGRPA